MITVSELILFKKRVKGMTRHYVEINGIKIFYFAIVPQADETALAELGKRLMFCHNVFNGGGIQIAAKGELHYGWVMGIVAE